MPASSGSRRRRLHFQSETAVTDQEVSADNAYFVDGMIDYLLDDSLPALKRVKSTCANATAGIRVIDDTNALGCRNLFMVVLSSAIRVHRGR